MMALTKLLAFGTYLTESPAFEDWKRMHGKNYSSTEHSLRKFVYETNVAKIAEHNLQGRGWTMAVNKFADLTPEEFASRYASSFRPVQTALEEVDSTSGGSGSYYAPETKFKLRGNALPASVDWVAAGAVTPVKNQGQCGSCWSFSTTGAVEGAHYLATKQLVSLSEQQLVDCSTAQGNSGCNGGLMDYAFQYIIDNKGITTEANYPYTAMDGTCDKTKAAQVAATITSYKDVTTNSEDALVAAIAQQPVSVAVEADQASFQFYSSGVMTAACGTQLDHGVLAVGYGTMNGQDYYKVKNSWGADWGMSGYILLGRGASFNPNGQCGIQMQPSFPVV